MEKHFRVIGLITFLTIILVACSSTQSIADKPQDVLPEDVSVTHNGVTVAVKPSLELISIVQYMADDGLAVKDGLITRVNSDYKRKIDEHFRQFSNHPAVEYYEKSDSVFWDELPALSVLLNSDFTVDKEGFENRLIQFGSIYNDGCHFKNIEMLQNFFYLLKDFYMESNFEEFYNNHRDYYYTIVDTIVKTLPEEDIIGAMEEFYGKLVGTCNIVPVSLFHSGGFGPSVTRDGQMDIYSLTGPYEEEENIPLFGSTEEFRELTIHEFGHSFIPIAAEDVFADLINQSEYLFEPITEALRNRGYGAWHSALEELILRACVIKITEKLDSFNTNVEQLLQNERDIGFMYIDTVYDCINDYVENREIYPTFDDFIPVIIDNLMVVHK